MYNLEMIVLNNYLQPQLSGELRSISVLGLAHVGDAVFELMVRTWLCTNGTSTAKQLHGGTVAFVSARAQAEAAERMLPLLSEEERTIFKRGRNAHANSVPRGSTYEEYHIATGVEALVGHLCLSGKPDRLGELFEMVISVAEQD
jgi:ribonuclease-3 family protein